MKLLQFIFITFFIQIGFSQEYLNEKLTDIITFDNKFIKQLDDSCVEKLGFLRTSPVNFKIDSTKLLKKGKTDRIYISVLFRNYTKSLILIDKIKGGSNYVPNNYDLVLLPNEQKSIEMVFGFHKTPHKLGRTLHFRIKKLEEKQIEIKQMMIYRKHNFEFIGN